MSITIMLYILLLPSCSPVLLSCDTFSSVPESVIKMDYESYMCTL